MEFDQMWKVGQLVLLKEYADFSTIYAGQISHVYENRLVVVITSEEKVHLPRIRKIKNNVWESIVREDDIVEGYVLIKPFPIKENIMELLDAKTDTSI